MSKFFQILLAAIYLLLTSYTIIVLLELWGLLISHLLTLELCSAWAAFCFSSAYFQAGIALARAHVRKPVKEEEDKLNGYFEEVLQQAGIKKSIRLLIEEEMGCNAFAIGPHTIVVSRGILEKMEPAELKAILAHELGHLESKDCVVGAAFSTASIPPLIISIVYKKGKRLFLRGFRFTTGFLNGIGRFLLLVFLIGLLYWLYSKHFMMPLLATGLFVFLLSKVNNLFLFFWKMTYRYIEYKQDAFASKLGYGTALRQALLKSTSDEPQSVSLYEIITRSVHPVIYNRIRRLEKLEGLR
jgi:Zn-dependent protease with chaperone function